MLKTCVGNLCWFVDVLDTPDSLKLLDLLESVDVQQHVTQPTHVHRHTLDLIIPQHSDQIVQDPPQTMHHSAVSHFMMNQWWLVQCWKLVLAHSPKWVWKVSGEYKSLITHRNFHFSTSLNIDSFVLSILARTSLSENLPVPFLLFLSSKMPK